MSRGVLGRVWRKRTLIDGDSEGIFNHGWESMDTDFEREIAEGTEREEKKNSKFQNPNPKEAPNFKLQWGAFYRKRR